MQGLPLSAVLDAGPGGYRPDIVELPVQRSHAVRHQASPPCDGGSDGIGLLDLAEVQHVLEIARPVEIAAEHLVDYLVALVVPLMVLHHGTFKKKLVRRGKREHFTH